MKKVIQIRRDDTMNDIDCKITNQNIIELLTEKSISQGNNSLELLYTWPHGDCQILLYGWQDGEAGFENKHELPPHGNSDSLELDSSEKLLFGDIFLLKKRGNKFIDFDDYLLGMDFTCKRNPDDYNEFLFAILKNFDLKRLRVSESLFLKSEPSSEELMEVKVEGVTYKCQRYCPHMGADLKKSGYIDKNNKLVCPLHNWAFDLKSGKCDQSSNHILKTEKIDE